MFVYKLCLLEIVINYIEYEFLDKKFNFLNDEVKFMICQLVVVVVYIVFLFILGDGGSYGIVFYFVGRSIVVKV